MKWINFLTTLIKKHINKNIQIFCLLISSIIFCFDYSIYMDGQYHIVDGEYYKTSTIYYDESNYYDGYSSTQHIFEVPYPAIDYWWDEPRFYFNISGDFDGDSEYADILIESQMIGTMGSNFFDEYQNNDNNCNFFDEYYISPYEFNNYVDEYSLDSNSIRVTIQNSEEVGYNICGDDFHKVSLKYKTNLDNEFNLGDIPIGESKNFDLIIYNNEFGWEDEEGTEFVIIALSGDSSFYCTDGDITCGNQFIELNDNHTVNITFTPSEVQNFESILYIYGDTSAGNNLKEIKLTGAGVLLQTLGDLNSDDILNVYDIIILIDNIFNINYNPVGDMNSDGMLNVADIILLVNNILDDVSVGFAGPYLNIPTSDDNKDSNNSSLPNSFELKQNYPNPFNPSTTIDFTVPNVSNVKINIFDLNGRLVNTLINNSLASGKHSVIWNSDDLIGNKVSAGIYIYTLTSNEISITNKMILVK
ncbi:T9SS type A sorting domain-containing protein [Candidatus Marinimicrobia bacterium]|nr:T9SS type A sorting domain-containing protein [Candidatus Neomarinimicrobiota bacterium]